MNEALTDCGLPLLASTIRLRAAFRTAALDGVSVFQMGRRGAPAAAEVHSYRIVLGHRGELKVEERLG